MKLQLRLVRQSARGTMAAAMDATGHSVRLERRGRRCMLTIVDKDED